MITPEGSFNCCSITSHMLTLASSLEIECARVTASLIFCACYRHLTFLVQICMIFSTMLSPCSCLETLIPPTGALIFTVFSNAIVLEYMSWFQPLSACFSSNHSSNVLDLVCSPDIFSSVNRFETTSLLIALSSLPFLLRKSLARLLGTTIRLSLSQLIKHLNHS